MYVFVCVECVEILGKKKSDFVISLWSVFDFVQARNQLPYEALRGFICIEVLIGRLYWCFCLILV